MNIRRLLSSGGGVSDCCLCLLYIISSLLSLLTSTATNCGSTGHRKTYIDVYKSIHLWPVVDPQFVAVLVNNESNDEMMLCSHSHIICSSFLALLVVEEMPNEIWESRFRKARHDPFLMRYRLRTGTDRHQPSKLWCLVERTLNLKKNNVVDYSLDYDRTRPFPFSNNSFASLIFPAM
jgi:hypothetical protein